MNLIPSRITEILIFYGQIQQKLLDGEQRELTDFERLQISVLVIVE